MPAVQVGVPPSGPATESNPPTSEPQQTAQNVKSERTKLIEVSKTVSVPYKELVIYSGAHTSAEGLRNASSTVVYFLRYHDDPVVHPASFEEAEALMPLTLEYGMLSGHALLMLEHALQEVYLPLLNNYTNVLIGSGSAAGNVGPDKLTQEADAAANRMIIQKSGSGRAGARSNEFIISMSGFAAELTMGRHAEVCITGGTHSATGSGRC